jgi:hypothetical protein
MICHGFDPLHKNGLAGVVGETHAAASFLSLEPASVAVRYSVGRTTELVQIIMQVLGQIDALNAVLTIIDPV